MSGKSFQYYGRGHINRPSEDSKPSKGSVIRLATKTSSGSGCGEQINITSNYDQGVNGIGRRTSMTSVSNGQTVSSSWTYDARGRVETETAMGYLTEWEYNSADLPVRMEYPDGEQVEFSYNDRMLLTGVEGTSPYISSMTYDPAGRLRSRALGNGLTQTYDYYDWDDQVDNMGQGGRLSNMLAGALQDLN